MDFLLINSAKLKVTLSHSELGELGIEASDADYDESCLRGSISHILAEAQKQCGFKVGKERVLVQLYPSEDGAEIFVTKLSIMTARERRAVSEADGLSTYSRRLSFYRFDSLTDLIGAARATNGVKQRCDIFSSVDGRFYIRLEEDGMDGVTISDRLLEYGARITSLPSGIEGEYGSLLIKEEGLSLLSRM